MAKKHIEPVEENQTSENKIAVIFLLSTLGIIVLLALGGSFLLKGPQNRGIASVPTTLTSNISEEADKQIVSLSAKGGFDPIQTVAKAGKPTVLKVSTKNTFDCTSVINIPSLGLQKNLPASGTTEIEIPAQNAGTKLAGTCSMGMYNFSINFIQ